MAIIVRLDVLMAERKVKSIDLAERLGLPPVAASRLKTGKIKAMRLETMDAICKTLGCQPGDLFEYIPDEEAEGLFDLDSPEDAD